MSKGLAKTYSKEIIKELDKIPVYLPGANVKIGDVITFGKGFLKPKPLGSFQQVTDLESLNINFKIEKDSTPDSYIYSSKKGVKVDFNADIDTGKDTSGTAKIVFEKEGAIYFAGIDCLSHHMKSTAHLQSALDKHKNTINWKNCFIVTGVTTAKKALICQSSSKTATLEIKGKTQGFKTGVPSDLSVEAEFIIEKSGSTSFLKDWSEDVTVFFTLMRYRKKLFGGSELETTKSMFINHDNDEYELFSVRAEDLYME